MKNIFKLSALLLLSLTITVISCKKDEDIIDDGNNNNTTVQKCYPATKTVDGTLDEEYTYDANNKLVSITTYDSTGTTIKNVSYFEWSGEFLVNLFDIEDGDTTSYLTFSNNGTNYTSAVISTSNQQTNNLTEMGNYYFEYANGKPVTTYLTADFGFGLLTLDSAVYTWNGDNIATLEQHEINNQTFEGTVLVATYSYTYDTKKNPMSELPLIPIMPSSEMNANNVTLISKVAPGSATQTSTYTYTYNDNDYPTNYTRTNYDGVTTIEHIMTYNCQ